MKKNKPKKPKIRIPLPKQLPKIKESGKVYKRNRSKKFNTE
ncbi:MAG: hypothetical protein AB1432_13140 [Bacteroidota bacterium]